MTISDIDHVAIAVNSLSRARQTYEKLLETSPRREVVEDQQAKIDIYSLENSRLELLEPLSEESDLHRYLEKKGEGLHHVAIRTEAVDRELERTKKLDSVTCIDHEPRIGVENYKIAFLHPDSLHGALIELAQPPL